MMQKWQKLGLVYCPTGEDSWAMSHASNPIAQYLSENKFKVFFSSRDSHNRSQICSILMDLSNNKPQIIKDSLEHVLSHGDIGYFDDSGVTVSCLIRQNKKIYLYYLGWNLAKTIPFRNSIGLAVSVDNGLTFKRYSKGAIIDRNLIDTISIAYPYVLFDGEKYRMWYGSCEEWNGSSVKDYFFSIKIAESKDGINWERNGLYALRCNRDFEDAVSRPHVVKDQDLYRMWYSKKKGKNYSIGYAESLDGINWERLDSTISFKTSLNGWDSEMIAYPFVFDHNGSRYMLYNGNSYGKTGFGLAVLDTEKF